MDDEQEQPFWAWVLDKRNSAGIVAVLVYVAAAVPKVVTSVPRLKELLMSLGVRDPNALLQAPHTNPLLSALQCLFLLQPLYMLSLKLKPPRMKKGNAIAVEACQQFRRFLVGLVLVWILFYLLLTVRQFLPATTIATATTPSTTTTTATTPTITIKAMQATMITTEVKTRITTGATTGLVTTPPALAHLMDPFIDLLNNMQAVLLFVCYWVLAVITIGDGPAYSMQQNPPPKAVSPPIKVSLLLSYLLWGFALFLSVDLAFSFSNLADAARPWLQLFSGLGVGTSLGLVVGCLESEYLPQERFAIGLLYLYAVLQLSYVGFNQQNAPYPLQGFATILSLPLKLVFIEFCFWVVSTGRLVFYMKNTRDLMQDVPKQWKDFQREIIPQP